jgi:hypothetical protein
MSDMAARPRKRAGRAPAMLLRLALGCSLLGAMSGCSTKAPPPPKPPTEAELRSHWTPEETDRAIASVRDIAAQQALGRHFAERAREAQGRGMKLVVESILLGEDMGIGGGLSIVRLFALYHEYDDSSFVTYLAAFEVIDGRIRTEFRRPVGGSKAAFVRLDFAELNRVILKVYSFDPKDQPCCPSREGMAGFQLGPVSLEPLQ